MTCHIHNVGFIKTYSFAVIMFLSLFLCLLLFSRCNPISEPPQPIEPTDTISSDTVQVNSDTIPMDTIYTDEIPKDSLPFVEWDTTEQYCDCVYESQSIVLIKFSDTTQLDYVMVSKQLKEEYGLLEYEQIKHRYGILTNDFDFYGMDSLNEISDFSVLEKYLHLTKSSPYVKLAKDYVMIDWRWIGIFPTKMFRVNKIYEIFNNEMNVLPLKWQDLNDVFTKWEPTIEYTPPRIASYYICPYFKLDAYRGEVSPNIGYDNGHGQMSSELGMSALLAMRTYNALGEEALARFVIDADSIMNRYKETIIEALDKNELSRIGYYEFYYP